MTAVDTNLLVYAHRQDSQWHAQAARIVRDLAQGPSPWLVPWPCLHEFLAVASHPRIYRPPSTIEQAIVQVEIWLTSPTLTLGSEGVSYWDSLKPLLQSSKVSGPMVHDAHIAAICIEQGVTALLTADRDFGRFTKLKVINPLVP